MSEPILSAIRVQKIYQSGEKELKVLKGLDLDLYKGEAACIVGSSGAGKSTFLHILGTLDQPTLGQVFFKGRDLSSMSDEEQAKFRNESLGFVFQFHHLLSEFTALENVAMPLRIGGQSARASRIHAEELLKLMGLSDRKTHFPSELSGGEQQRVAIARALSRNPEVLLADEPTGNLDTENERVIQDLFFDLKSQLGLTLVVVTHDSQFAAKFPRRMQIKDGQWVS